jgi:hypothetical protein
MSSTDKEDIAEKDWTPSQRPHDRVLSVRSRNALPPLR